MSEKAWAVVGGLFAGAVCCGCVGAHLEPTPPATVAPPPLARAVVRPVAKAPVALEEYLKVSDVRGGASFSHDEALVAWLSSRGGQPEVWVEPVEGGPARQLTHTNGFVGGFEFSPTQDLMVYTADAAGDGAQHLYVTDSTGRAPTPLIPDEKPETRTDFLQWAQDGRSFLYMSNRRDPQFMDLYTYELATKRSQLVWKPSGTLTWAGASRDLRQHVLVDNRSDVDNALFLFSPGQAAPVALTPHTGQVLYWPAEFSPDGKSLYAVSDEGGEFQALVRIDLKTKQKTVEAAPRWDVDSAQFSARGTYFVTRVNVDGAAEVTMKEVKTGQRVPLEGFGTSARLVPRTFSPSDRFLVARTESERAPRGQWLLDLKEHHGRALEESLPESLAGRAFVEARSVRVPSFDGRDVPAFLLSPPGPGPFPAVIQVHGGPTSQAERRFDPLAQYLVSKGYVVLAPNVRGSTGYGKTWTTLDNRDLGGGPLKDVVACRAWLVEHAHVDGARVALMGESYGGYMALAAAAFTPTQFAAHVDFFGPSDLKSLVESFPPYFLAFGGLIFEKFGNPSDPKDAQYQHDRSPIHFAGNITQPLLVIQGANDTQVKKEQSEAIVKALKGRAVDVEYLLIEGEGHGFSKTENKLRAYQTVDRFLDRVLLEGH